MVASLTSRQSCCLFILVAVCIPSPHAIEVALGFGVSEKSSSGSVFSAISSTVNYSVTSEKSAAPSISLTASEHYIYRRFGMLAEAFLTSYDVSIQSASVTIDGVPFASNIQGSNVDTIPIFYYRLGDKFDKGARGWKFTLGYGYGIGWLSAKGQCLIPSSKRPSKVQPIYVAGNNANVAVGYLVRLDISRVFFIYLT